MSDRPVFLYAAAYSGIADAEADFEAVFELHDAGVIGTFDAAVIEKSGGKVHVHKTEKPTQHGAWTGIGVGALVGILFPPSIIAAAAVGGVAGGVAGHLWKGMSRGDLKDLGEMLDDLRGAIWSELTAREPIGVYRRNLQRGYIERMGWLMTSDLSVVFAFGAIGDFFTRVDVSQSDIRAFVRGELDTLKREIQRRLTTGPDRVTRLHLQDVIVRIDDILDPSD